MKVSKVMPFDIADIHKSKTSATSLERRRARSIIREFALNTSTHALPAIARSENKINRLFWLASFILFAGIMSLFITQTIINYFQYPAQTSVSIVADRTQSFPAVTFCNGQFSRWDTLFNDFSSNIVAKGFANITPTSILTPEYFLLLFNFLVDQVNNNQSINQFFFGIDIMLMSCNYNGIQCSRNDFITFVSPTHGSCYTFNAQRLSDNKKVVRVNENGAVGILKLEFYPHRHLYVPLPTQDFSTAVVFMIHDNTELPMIDVAGLYLSSGKRHRLSFKKRSTYFLPSPYTDCNTEIPPTMKAMFSKYEDADYEYSQEICDIFCKQAFIYDECGCVDPNQWLARAILLPGTNELIEAKLCYSTNACMLNASMRLSQNETLWNNYCSRCTQACKSVDFIVTNSQANAVASQSLLTAKSFVEKSGVPLPTNWSTDWIEEVKENYIAVDIICRSVIVENFTQSPSYGPVDLLSNVGGQTGLWIGISFLSIMELIEMFVRIIIHKFLIRK